MIHSLLLIFVVALNSAVGDFLDSVKSNSSLINDLKDAYRAYQVNHVIDDQKENINLSLQSNDGGDLKNVLTANIAQCANLKNPSIQNAEVKSRVNDYVAATMQNYQVMLDKGISSDEFKKNYDDYKSHREKYYDFLLKQFSMDKFVKLSEAQYWQNIDKKNYRLAKQYSYYDKIKKENWRAAVTILDTLVSSTADFQEQSIYKIELADNFVKHSQEIIQDSSDSYEKAINYYRTILDQKKYSLYLYEAWLKWRCILQRTKGFSHSSEIPNDVYNELREQTASTILSQISNNEHDDMAINQFLVIATHDIIKRFGQYKYGNQNSVEFHEIFGETK